MISIQTNVASLVAEQNLQINNQFQQKTIQQLTSGYRINSSADDAAGLAVANQFRSQNAELTQGVLNANNGISTLQIVDGGLNNITTMLDRLTTLATESAASTFTGNRDTLNTEYQQLVGEISRQADNIGLNAGGANNTNLSVYIGGGRAAQNTGQASGTAAANVDLSGAVNAVDAKSLALTSSGVGAGGVNLGAITTQDATALAQNFQVNYADGTDSTQNNAATSLQFASGKSVADIVSALNGNTDLAAHGISFSTAVVNGVTDLLVSGSQAFSINVAQGTANTTFLQNTAAAANAVNTAKFNQTTAGYTNMTAGDEYLNFTTQAGSAKVDLGFASGTGLSITSAINAINSNAQMQALGITAVVDGTGSNISFQSNNFFNLSIDDTTGTPTGGIGTANAGTMSAANTAATATGNATAAIASINAALNSLGLIQGKVGAGQNKLQYAINLAQSQITNYSSTEAQVRDADVAAEAANLTKAQVLQQSSIAAMAQANSAPQALLKLFQ